MAVNCTLATPLHYAALAGHYNIVRMLVSEGLRLQAQRDDVAWNIDARDKNGCTALHHAAAFGAVKVLDVLIRHQANVDACTRGGATPLHHAASNGQEHSARRLLTNNGNVNALDDNRSTALHLAAFYGNAGVARILLACGAQREIVDACGHTALHAACASRAREVVQLLEGNAVEHWSSAKISPRQHQLRRRFSGDDTISGASGMLHRTTSKTRKSPQARVNTFGAFDIPDISGTSVGSLDDDDKSTVTAHITKHIDDLGSPPSQPSSPQRPHVDPPSSGMLE